MTCVSTIHIEPHQTADLPAMLATLSSYEHLFGPRHELTLTLSAHIAESLRSLGHPKTARALLERVVEGLGRTNATRVSALDTLRDLLLELGDTAAAIPVQSELSECWSILRGSGAPQTVAARARLHALLMSSPEWPITH